MVNTMVKTMQLMAGIMPTAHSARNVGAGYRLPSGGR